MTDELTLTIDDLDLAFDQIVADDETEAETTLIGWQCWGSDDE